MRRRKGPLDLISFLRFWIRSAAEDGLDPVAICREASKAVRLVAGRAPLPLRARFYLRVRGFYPVITLRTPDWGPLPFYLVRCREHGLFVSYPRGYRGYFVCPRCLEEGE